MLQCYKYPITIAAQRFFCATSGVTQLYHVTFPFFYKSGLCYNVTAMLPLL